MLQTNSIPNWLKKRAYLSPDRPAIIFEDRTITFHELYLLSKQFAKKLTTNKIKKGDRVAVLLNNHLDTVILLHALQLIGCETVLLNIRLHANELLFQIKDSEASFLMTSEEFREKINDFKNDLTIPILEMELISDTPESEFKEIAEFNLNDICTIMYTSGTTGFPKGVLQTYGNHWWSAIGSVLNLGLTEKDAWLCVVPIFHISGFSILIRNVVYGIPIILYEKFDELEVNQALIQGKATIISVVTNMLQRMVQTLGEEKYDASFRCALLGGGPVPLSLLEKCKERNIPVFQSYGMTETASQIVTLAPEDSFRKLGSAGKPLFPSQIKIMNEQKELEPLEIGEITVKGPNVTPGYFKREESNQNSFTEDGWFYTGDLGYLDEEGFLFVMDRRSDLIISGGENIYPAEVENIIMSHPAVIDAGVVGMKDKTWGEVPCAFYVVDKGKEVSSEELAQFCANHLAKYKIPRKWVEVEDLPRNASRKLLRRRLRELL